MSRHATDPHCFYPREELTPPLAVIKSCTNQQVYLPPGVCSHICCASLTPPCLQVGRYGPELFDFSAERVTRSVTESLQRLQIPYIDLIQCHDIEFGSLDQVRSEQASLPVALPINNASRTVLRGIANAVDGGANACYVWIIRQHQQAYNVGICAPLWVQFACTPAQLPPHYVHLCGTPPLLCTVSVSIDACCHLLHPDHQRNPASVAAVEAAGAGALHRYHWATLQGTDICAGQGARR